MNERIAPSACTGLVSPAELRLTNQVIIRSSPRSLADAADAKVISLVDVVPTMELL